MVDSITGGCYDFFDNRKEIEVAFFMSTMTDVSGTVELTGKGKMPKGWNA